LETWVFGAIFALVGVLIIVCALGQEEFGLILTIAGVSSTIIGSIIFTGSFKKWVDHSIDA
jgi:hypothetical protein